MIVQNKKYSAYSFGQLVKKKFDWVDFCYVISVVMAFGLLFFANEAESPDGTVMSEGLGKLFYVPCLTALLFSVFKRHKIDRVDRLIILLIILSILSSIINPPSGGSPLTWALTRFCFGILCFWNIRNVSPVLFVRVLALVSPLIVFTHYLLTNPFAYGLYRYAGFYGDPNYLAMGLNFIIVIEYLNWKWFHSVFSRILSLVTIIGAIPLILVGVSRGGVIGLVFILLFIAWDLFRNSKKRFALLVLAAILLASPIAARFSSQFSDIETRFDRNSDSDARSADSRILEIQSVVNVFSSHPVLILFGVGLGNNMRAAEMYPEDYIDKFQVHNTFFKLLFEQGIFAFIVFCILMFKQFMFTLKNKQKIYLGLYMGALVTTMTLGCITFMPFWIVFFFLWNRGL